MPKTVNYYGEFRVEIDRDGRIKARLTRADGSSAPPAKGQLSEDQLVLNSINAVRGRLTDEENPIRPDDLRIFGQALYRAVLPGEVGDLLEHAVQGVQEKMFLTKQDWQLRVVVEVNLKSEVFGWPLELLYYDDGKNRGWLATEDLPIIFSRRTEISGPTVPPPERGPLRVLVVVSNPDSLGGGTTQEILKEMGGLVVAGGDAARVEKRFEVRMLAEEQGAGLADTVQHAGRPEWRRIDELGEDEERWRPHVLHFIGHGKLDETGEKGWLALVRGDEVDWCSADDLIRAVGNWNLRMVVLQACEKAVSGTEPALMRLADDLVRADIPAVVATQLSMTNRCAIEFAKGFYRALLEGGEVDQAVQRGRREIYRDSRGSSPAFGTPVLFTYSPARIIDTRKRDIRGAASPIKQLIQLSKTSDFAETADRILPTFQKRILERMEQDRTARQLVEMAFEAIQKGEHEWGRELLDRALEVTEATEPVVATRLPTSEPLKPIHSARAKASARAGTDNL